MIKRIINFLVGKLDVCVPCTLIMKETVKENNIKNQYSAIFEEEAMVSKTDREGKITFVNNKFLETTGYSKKELIGKKHSVLKSPNTNPAVFANIWATITDGNVWSGFIESEKKNKEPLYSKLAVYPIFDDKNNIIEFLGVRTDVTDIIGMKKQIEESEREIVLAVGTIGENRSGETGLHVKRVAEYSYLLACAYGLPQSECDLLRMASPMHDIGKVAIPDSILNKPDKLTDAEYDLMKQHTIYGYNMFKDSKLKVSKASGLISYQHHEKWDGTGYPNGVKGEDIHIFARITAIADVFDALRSERVYKKSWGYSKIIDYFDDNSGKQFDPILVDIFKKKLRDIKRIEKKFSDK